MLHFNTVKTVPENYPVISPKALGILLIALWLSGCATTMPSAGGGDLLGTQEARVNPNTAQDDPLADDALNLMVAEIALNRGDTDTAVEYYMRVARSQNNPEIAERAVRVAVYGQNLEAAIEAAQRWIELDPARVEARAVALQIGPGPRRAPRDGLGGRADLALGQDDPPPDARPAPRDIRALHQREEIVRLDRHRLAGAVDARSPRPPPELKDPRAVVLDARHSMK